MENFMLWGITVEPGTSSLSFFATRIQVPCIHQGTREMIDTMLADIKGPNIDYTDWYIRHILNNYYSSVDQPIGSPDAWANTWEIRLNLTKPASPNLIFPSDDREIRRTYARDDTWDGSFPSCSAPYVIVARFYNQNLFARAIAAFSSLREPHEGEDPEVQDLIDGLKKHPCSSGISARQRTPSLMEIAIALGTFDEVTFPAQGGRLAEQVSELIHEFGATITWDEKAAYWMEQQRHSQRPT